ncbi:peptidoglycan editing factor PgeF [Barrientosiimonas marina]|uniref:Purine nucleoside phosphorylase n=1 Tax=Lentibacillus kimchii TaxID=1542911 RepID=A0ABW2URT4_9BACI
MLEPFQQQTDINLALTEWEHRVPGLKAGFTTHNSEQERLNMGLYTNDQPDKVINNRRQLASRVGFPLESWVAGEQIHQTKTHFVTEKDKGKGAADYTASLKGTDGLITHKTGILCTAVFADCVPLFFLDPVTGYIGLAHAGWKGTVARMGQKMVEAFQARGADPAAMLVAIGPCISRDVYEVDEEVIRHIPSALREKTVTSLDDHRFLVDLKQLNIEILLQQGIFRHNIDVTNYCTFRDESLFFSHRRSRGNTGRMLGYIGYEK